MKSVRNSDNDVEYIGCKITTDSSGLVIGRLSVCVAGDANGVEVSCQIHDPAIAEAINAMMSYSRIQSKNKIGGDRYLKCLVALGNAPFGEHSFLPRLTFAPYFSIARSEAVEHLWSYVEG